MKKVLKKTACWLLLFNLTLASGSVWAQNSGQQTENLAFKILQKQAAEYEVALSELLTKKISRYIPEDRFHLSARIYWNPHKIAQLKMENKALQRKSGKLPGFPVYVKKEEKGLDYYMGAGSVMKLKVEILIDDTLPEQYTRFIYNIVPIQGRFVPERGDTVSVTPISFPEAKEQVMPLEKDVPLTSDAASTAVIGSIKKGQKELDNLKPIILHPVLQKYVNDYEEYVNGRLTQLISEYVEKSNFLLNVKFYWNPDEIQKLKKLIVKADSEGKVKLPGFNVYLEERDSLYETIANSATLMRMEVSVMLDEVVSPEVEPFLKRLVPLSIKLLPERGDQLIIYRGHFPRLADKLRSVVAKTSDKSLQSDDEFINEIDEAYQRREYRRGVVLIDLMLAKTTDPYQRVPFLKKKGTFHMLLQEKELAIAAWEQVRRTTPEDRETIKLLEYLQ